jgi:hypothetical protein
MQRLKPQPASAMKFADPKTSSLAHNRRRKRAWPGFDGATRLSFCWAVDTAIVKHQVSQQRMRSTGGKESGPVLAFVEDDVVGEPPQEACTDWGNFQIPTTEAAVRTFRWGDDRWTWDDYLALHRNGAMEFGLDRLGSGTFQRQFEDESIQVFFLTTIVGRTWWCLSRYTDVVARYELEGPYQISLAFRDSLGSGLGNVAAGWEEPEQSLGRDFPRCPDRNVLIVRTVDGWPEPDQLQELAFTLGANVEDAWGCQQRRFISRVRPNPGEFDVSRYR